MSFYRFFVRWWRKSLRLYVRASAGVWVCGNMCLLVIRRVLANNVLPPERYHVEDTRHDTPQSHIKYTNNQLTDPDSLHNYFGAESQPRQQLVGLSILKSLAWPKAKPLIIGSQRAFCKGNQHEMATREWLWGYSSTLARQGPRPWRHCWLLWV